MKVRCLYCDKELRPASMRAHHISKNCLETQKDLGILTEAVVRCSFCRKSFTSQSDLAKHRKKCKRRRTTLQQLNDKIEKLEEENKFLRDKLSYLLDTLMTFDT